ncbi:MAG: transposase [Desulfobacterales bacterium]|nr:transposase [Desulfobacterales bacterium]
MSELNRQEVTFITLRRRGHRLIEGVEGLSPWRRITIAHDKRKYPNPLIHESLVDLRGYAGPIRQIVMRGNGREKPAFLITNDMDAPAEVVVSDYARRWRVENGIAEAVKFFHLNALSSPILIKVHFDVVMTMIADTLYSRLAMNLRGFESCDAMKVYRHFVRGRAVVDVKEGKSPSPIPKEPIILSFVRFPGTDSLRRSRGSMGQNCPCISSDRDAIMLYRYDGYTARENR